MIAMSVKLWIVISYLSHVIFAYQFNAAFRRLPYSVSKKLLHPSRATLAPVATSSEFMQQHIPLFEMNSENNYDEYIRQLLPNTVKSVSVKTMNNLVVNTQVNSAPCSLSIRLPFYLRIHPL
jgi:hypothetical protein